MAVAAGLVSFALGTDTAGSGRVPAAFNNIVGLKPTRGILSTHGVVPACRSLDCVSLLCLNRFRQETSDTWNVVDFLLLPTAPDIFRIAEVESDPVALTSRLGIFTNFLNLLDLAAVAAPAGFRADGLPFGITFVGQTFSDRSLLALAGTYLGSLRPSLGGTRLSYPETFTPKDINSDRMMIAVAGAHLTGEPLNYQLTSVERSLER